MPKAVAISRQPVAAASVKSVVLVLVLVCFRKLSVLGMGRSFHVRGWRGKAGPYAFAAVKLKLVMVIFWPACTLVLSSVTSPPAPVKVTVPCACTVVPLLA